MMQYLLIFSITILGWLSGKLVNYLSDVLPKTRRLSSVSCRYCQRSQPFDIYLGIKYRCPFCGAPYPTRQWIVDIISIITTLFLWLNPPLKLGFGISWLLIIYLGIVLIIDIENHLVLHIESAVGVLIGFAIGVWRHGFLYTLFGGIFGFSIMFFLYLLGVWFSIWIARKRGEQLTDVGLGFGDVNFAGVMGILLGWPGIILGLTLTILFGGAGGSLYMIWQLLNRRYKKYSSIPYAPFMVLSVIILLFR